MSEGPEHRSRNPALSEDGIWRTILSAIESNSKTVRLIAIILVIAKAAAAARTGW